MILRCTIVTVIMIIDILTWPKLLIRLVAWLSGNAFDSINEVTLRRAGLVLGWVIARGQVNHLGM